MMADDSASERRALRALGRRSDSAGLKQLAGHLAALTTTGTIVFASRGSIWLLPAMALHGIVLIFLFAPLHETIHRTAFRRRWLNDAVAWPCGLLLLLPPQCFRAFHFAHHRFTQDPKRDPELVVAKPSSLRGYLWHVSGLPYWSERASTMVRHACGQVDEPFVAPRLRGGVVREARVMIAVYGLVAALSIWTASPWALIFWFGPALLGQPFLRLYLLAEHTGCPLVRSMLQNSRTTRSVALVRRLAWNMPYHAEHHAHPSLPFFALPAAHRLLQERIAVQARGYVAVNREIIAALGRDREA